MYALATSFTIHMRGSFSISPDISMTKEQAFQWLLSSMHRTSMAVLAQAMEVVRAPAAEDCDVHAPLACAESSKPEVAAKWRSEHC